MAELASTMLTCKSGCLGEKVWGIRLHAFGVCIKLGILTSFPYSGPMADIEAPGAKQGHIGIETSLDMLAK